MIFIRLMVSAWLIWMVALGHTWALVYILVLMTLANEAARTVSKKALNDDFEDIASRKDQAS